MFVDYGIFVQKASFSIFLYFANNSVLSGEPKEPFRHQNKDATSVRGS